MIINYIIVGFLIMLSGIFSGLTLGLFSLDLSALERKKKLGDKRAGIIYPVRKNGNLLLCTLLLGNVAVNSATAIFLGGIASGIVAGIVSTGLIVIFGEIIPQAVFSRFALNAGAKMVWLVKIFIFLTFPVSFPLAWLLDKALGKELPTIWNKSEMKEIIREHEDSPLSAIDSAEEKILLGALSFSDKKAQDVMTPAPVVFCLENQQIINQELLILIREKGFTRLPVYQQHKDHIKGILLVKKLIGVCEEQNLTAGDISDAGALISVKNTAKLDILFDLFIKKKKHMACIFDQYGVFLGIVTLEDVIEEILKVEIVDEADQAPDMQKLARDQFDKKLIE